MKNVLICGLMVISVALSACGKNEDQAVTRPSSPPLVQGMNQQVAAIKGCMEEGLSEETCVTVHKQMVTGTLTGSPSISACEAQYGVGKCDTVPVARPDGSSGSIILPLVAGAAMGYIAHSLMSSNSMPSGATTPQRSWLNNRPPIYQQVAQGQRQTSSIIGKDVKPVQQPNGYAVKSGYAQQSVNVNGNPVAENNKLPTPYVVPGAVKPTQAAPQAPAKVEYKAPTSGYARPQQPAQVSRPPSVSYSSSRSGKR